MLNKETVGLILVIGLWLLTHYLFQFIPIYLNLFGFLIEKRENADQCFTSIG